MKKGNREINYLDLTIKINEQNKFQFDIYRKPTHTDSVIPNDPYHHPKHKLAAFQNYCFRANNILKDKANKQKEIETIKSIAKNNGYPTEIIDKIIHKQNKKATQKDKTKYYGAIPYIRNENRQNNKNLQEIQHKCRNKKLPTFDHQN